MTIEELFGPANSGLEYHAVFDFVRNGGVDWKELSSRLKAMDYSDFLQTAYWAAVSEEVKFRADNRCQVCNGGGSLQSHHRTYQWHGQEHCHMSDLIALCDRCHGLYHKKEKGEAPKIAPIPLGSKRAVRKAQKQRREQRRAMRGKPDGEGWIKSNGAWIRGARHEPEIRPATPVVLKRQMPTGLSRRERDRFRLEARAEARRKHDLIAFRPLSYVKDYWVESTPIPAK